MKSNIPTPAIIAAVVVLVFLAGFFGLRALNQTPERTGIGGDGKPIAGAGASGASSITPGAAIPVGGEPAKAGATKQMVAPSN